MKVFITAQIRRYNEIEDYINGIQKQAGLNSACFILKK